VEAQEEAMTVYDLIAGPMRHDFRKHGPSLYAPDEDEHIKNQLNRMDRREFLEAISDAIEERLNIIDIQIKRLEGR
jgi:hypothetical protein